MMQGKLGLAATGLLLATGAMAAVTPLVRFGEAYRNHLVAMDVEQYARVFTAHEEVSEWQTEFWGKYMHSAVPLLQRFPNAELERKVHASAKLVMDAQLEDGYLGNYREGYRAQERWDIWGIKYTLMGLLYYYDYTRAERPLACARKLADWLLREVGPGGKRRIVTTGCYAGMASCSVLEPIVWLYRVTGERRYLDFAAEIVRQVGYDADGPQLVVKALAGVPVAERGVWRGKWCSDAKTNAMKAYEMMSCYYGMLAYREVAKGAAAQSAELLTAAVKTAEDIMAHEVNLIGGAGSVEFWYGGAAKETQAHADESETCVTITWMRLCEKLYGVTGDERWLAAFRKSFFNVYLGALAPDGARFSSYPSLNGKRTYFRSHCGMDTDCCNQNGMRGFVSALNLGVIAGDRPETVKAVKDPRGEWSWVEKHGHLAFKCGELVMVTVGEAAVLPVEMDRGFDFEKLKPTLVPFAEAGDTVYRTWREIARHPWDGRL